MKKLQAVIYIMILISYAISCVACPSQENHPDSTDTDKQSDIYDEGCSIFDIEPCE